MKISMIIPTYNEIGVLEKCIESLGYQSETDFEIIVIDDGSTDGTVKVLENLKSLLPNFKYYQEKHLGAGAARNFGAMHANGKILVFVDADMTFDKEFLRNLVKPITVDLPFGSRGGIMGTFSKEEYVFNWDNVWARCWNINENWEVKRRHPKKYPDFQPVFRSILKSEFDRVNGFTPGGYDDDWSLSKKLGYEAVSAPDAVFYHKNPSSLMEIFNQAKWIGKRKYKFGMIGNLIALFRASMPVSFIIGIYKSVIYNNFSFLIFKLIYDFGVFIGISEFLLSGKASK